MGAIGRSILLCCLAFTCLADNSQDLRRELGLIATALTAGNPGDALTPFDKTFKGYGKLRDYFTALTNAYEVNSEIEVADEDISETQATLTVKWSMTLKNADGVSETRADDVTLRLRVEKGKWRIVDLSPLEFFAPDTR